MARIDSFLRLVAQQGASDLHFHAGNVPIIRHEGELMSLPFRMLSEGETSRFLLEITSDVLVVGEMRDLETILLAISAAETGVLVIGTLHSSSASKAIDRIIDVIPEESRDQVRSTLSVLLRGVLSQHLAKHASGEGRVAVMEVLLQSYAVSNLIRENKVFQIDGYLDTASNDGSGMQSLNACLFRLVKQGDITVDEALKFANQPESLKSLAAQLPED